MRIRILVMLLSVALGLTVALLRPFAGRADTPPAPTGPDATTSTDPSSPLTSFLDASPATAHIFRRPASVAHHLAPLGSRIVDYARHLIGVRYEYGGSTPRSGFDCSGFVRYVYAHFGVSLAHSSFADYWRGRRVGRWQLKPGDLVFFDGAGHVGIYVGGGRFIHAPHTGTVVRISTLTGWYSQRFVGARRIA
jgi:cell wall-associated NlpC family hydrolase